MNNGSKVYDKSVQAKISSMISEIQVAPMITGFIEVPSFDSLALINVVDNKGAIWCITTSNNARLLDRTATGRTNLLFHDTSSMQMNIVSVYGEASLTSKINRADFKGNKQLKAWLKATSATDYAAIKLIPDEACFWNTEKNDYSTLFKLEKDGVIALDTDIVDKEIAMSA